MIQPEMAFILGYRLGKLARYLELVMERSSLSTKAEKLPIRVFYVYETLKYLEADMVRLHLPSDVREDITSYIRLLGDHYGEIRQRLENDAANKPDTQMLVTKLKKKLKKKKFNQELKVEDVRSLAIKLPIWKDRLMIALSKQATGNHDQTTSREK